MNGGSLDAIVVGLGVMGAAATWQLALSGRRVLALEQFEPGHPMGSSHGETRAFRLAYYEGPHYVPMMQRALELWREVEANSGQTLVTVTGTLEMAPENHRHVHASRASCVASGIRHEVLDRQALAARFPMFSVSPDHIGLWQPDGGFIAAEPAVIAMIALARAAGAEVRTGVAMTGWRATADGGVEVATTAGTLSAGRLVLATGGWMAGHVPALADHLQTVRQALVWLDPPVPDTVAVGRLPVFLAITDEGEVYGFPEVQRGRGVKVGGPHFARELIDIGEPDRRASRRQTELLARLAARVLPAAAGPELASRGCVYTMTPDEHFIVDVLPEAAQVITMSACSGHGFKFAPAIGEHVADLVAGRPSRLDVSPFAVSRFNSRGAAP